MTMRSNKKVASLATLTLAIGAFAAIIPAAGSASANTVVPAGPTATTTVTPTADTTIAKNAISATFGTRSYVVARDGDEAGLLRFNAVVPAGRKIIAAKLRLNSGNVGGSDVSVYAAGSNWSEGVSWAAAPPKGALLGKSGKFSPHQWVEYPATAVVPSSGGNVSFRIENPTHTYMGFNSREARWGTAPQLVLTTAPINAGAVTTGNSTVTTGTTPPPTPIATTIPAVADTTIDKASTSPTYATRTYLVARDATQAGLVKFDVNVPAGRQMVSATLRLNSGNVGGSAVSVYNTANTWSESVTWAGAPAKGSLLGTSGTFGARQWVSWNASSVVPVEGGTVSFRIENPTHTYMGFDTREQPYNYGPQLVINTIPIPKPITPDQPESTSPSGEDMPTTGQPGWQLTDAQDFSGTTLPAGWGTYDGPIASMPGGEWDRSHVKVGGGLATLTTTKKGGIWTSGGIMNNAARQTYGKYEVRMRMDKAVGVKYVALLWPASGMWPGDGEIDFAEDGGGNRQSATGTVIYSNDGRSVFKYQRPIGADFSQWHTVGVEWTKGHVVFTIDGLPWGTIDSVNVPTTPMNLAIQTEAGYCTTWMTCPDATTPDETQMQIDWVAIYKPSV